MHDFSNSIKWKEKIYFLANEIAFESLKETEKKTQTTLSTSTVAKAHAMCVWKGKYDAIRNNEEEMKEKQNRNEKKKNKTLF